LIQGLPDSKLNFYRRAIHIPAQRARVVFSTHPRLESKPDTSVLNHAPDEALILESV
jgi:hypothetical protein